MTERLLTYKDLMERLGVGENKARSLMLQMACVNVGNSALKPRYRVTEKAFEAWLNTRRVVPELAAPKPAPRKRKRGWTYKGVS